MMTTRQNELSNATEINKMIDNLMWFGILTLSFYSTAYRFIRWMTLEYTIIFLLSENWNVQEFANE